LAGQETIRSAFSRLRLNDNQRSILAGWGRKRTVAAQNAGCVVQRVCEVSEDVLVASLLVLTERCPVQSVPALWVARR